MYDSGNPKQELCDNLVGWGVRVIQKGRDTYACGQFDLMYSKNHYCEVIILQLKYFFKMYPQQARANKPSEI